MAANDPRKPINAYCSCGTVHVVPQGIKGASFWDYCPKCLKKEDDRLASILASRGITLNRK